LKDPANPLRLTGVDLEAATLGIDIISKDRLATQPFPFPARCAHLVPRPLGDQLPLELRIMWSST
jgi:hypothetical protein